MLKYLSVDIEISETHTQNVTVPEWELPILAAIHGRREPVVIKESLVDRAAPEADDEFRRLVRRYGSTENEDGSKGIPFVASVYGQFGIGDKALGQAIAKATVSSIEVRDSEFDDLIDGPVASSSVGG
jgi:hypothetical protein